MSKKQSALIVTLALLAGCLGGGLSRQLFNPVAASAQTNITDVVRTREILVVDSNGRARVSVGPNGLVIKDNHNRQRVSLEFSDNSASLRLTNSNGKQSFRVSTWDSITVLELTAPQGENHIVFSTDAEGPGLALRNGETNRALLSLRSDGSPSLILSDEDETIRALLHVLANGRAGLTLFDRDATIRAILGVLPNGKPSFTLADSP